MPRPLSHSLSLRPPANGLAYPLSHSGARFLPPSLTPPASSLSLFHRPPAKKVSRWKKALSPPPAICVKDRWGLLLSWSGGREQRVPVEIRDYGASRYALRSIWSPAILLLYKLDCL